MADDLVDVQDEIFTGSGDSGAPGDFQMPSQEELLATIEKMSGLDEATRKELLDGILGRQKMGGVAGEFVPPPVEKNTSLEIIMLFSMISAVFLVLAFFGYKLYKSLVERERRREEKKRQKLQKKKK